MYCLAVSLGSCWLNEGVKTAKNRDKKISTLRILDIVEK
jgi:hypothetical protein